MKHNTPSSPKPAPHRPPIPSVDTARAPAGDTRQLDVRGFEPPEPLVRILEALESLPVGVTLNARTDREPCHLFGEAAHRGFRHECSQQLDGSWITALAHA